MLLNMSVDRCGHVPYSSIGLERAVPRVVRQIVHRHLTLIGMKLDVTKVTVGFSCVRHMLLFSPRYNSVYDKHNKDEEKNEYEDTHPFQHLMKN